VKRLAILISGRGSNMEALLNANLPAKVTVVIGNNPAAPGLVTARQRGITTTIIDHRTFQDRSAFDNALAAEIDRHQPDLVALAGFMRVFTDSFVSRYRGRMLNIHPSLLPAFPASTRIDARSRRAPAFTAAPFISSPQRSTRVRS
jgi:phosphoribosylglycinamide formyltransferase-1